MTHARNVFGLLAAACAAVLLVACATPPPASEAEASGWPGVASSSSDLVAAGKTIAEAQCATCHAVGARTTSPLAGAPPLRDVLARYEDEEGLAYRFIDGMKVGHDEMPRFDFDVRSADALIAYLRSIS